MILIQHTSENKLWQHDTSLSLQAKGLMLVLTTAFHNCDRIARDYILEQCTNGDTSLRTALEELRLHNYFRLTAIKSDIGRITSWVWEVFDEPSSERLTIEPLVNINGQSIPLTA
ncbi:MAG: hypothetical protein IJ640_00125 [Prevotella sp.]|nr:hypothetical protein [Prevotella sp.]